MADPSTSIAKTKGGFDQAALMKRIFSGVVPYEEWAARVRHGAALDLERIDAAIRMADCGIMWPLTDMSREALALNPKAQGIAAKAVLPLANSDWDLTPAEGDGINKAEAERIATFTRAAITGIRNFEQARLDLAWAYYDGRAALETIYAPRNFKGETWPRSLEWIVPQRLSYGPSRELIVVDRWGDYGQFVKRGPALRDVPGKFIEFTPRMFADLQEREGLAPRFIYWLFFDRFVWRHRLKLTESFGFPWRIIEQVLANTLAGMKLPRADGGEGGAPNDDGDALDYTLAEAEAVTKDGVMVLLPGQKATIEYPPAEVNEFFTQGSDKILERLEYLALFKSITPDAPRANAIVLKSDEDVLIEFRAKLEDAAIQQGLVNVIVELNFGASALPLAPKYQSRNKQDRDRDKEVDRVLKVAAAVPVGAGVIYEASGYRPPNDGEAVIQTTPLTPSGSEAITRVDEGRRKLGQPPVGGEEGQRWIAEHAATFSAFGTAAGEQAAKGGDPPPDPNAPPGAAPPALPQGEGSSSDAVGALRELLEDADEDAQADAVDSETDLLGRLTRWFAGSRKVQPSSVNGSPEVLVEKGVREGARLIEPWLDDMLEEADGADPGKVYKRLQRAGMAVDIEPLARAFERRILHGLMLGGLDADWEMSNEVVIAVPQFAVVPAAAGVADFVAMPFGEAVKAFASRKVVTKRTFDRLLGAAKKKAFTIAGLERKAMVSLAHDELSKAIESGDDLRNFSKALNARFEEAGWKRLNPSHVETVFRNGVMGGYSDGRRAQMTQSAVIAARPYWQVFGVDDSRTRPTHKAAHGKVLAATDPFWDRAPLPWGHNCRDRAVSRSAADLRRLGLSVTIGAQLRGLPDEGWDASGSML